MSKHNDSEMFDNADEILHSARKLKSEVVQPLKGGLVITFSKELVGQVYKEGRLLDAT